ncbi:MAG: hypothetical protein OEX04_09460 [Acidimicrobiia bacterium]|nr:hypothetical protein [Acidimicrobiia bacterium]
MGSDSAISMLDEKSPASSADMAIHSVSDPNSAVRNPIFTYAWSPTWRSSMVVNMAAAMPANGSSGSASTAPAIAPMSMRNDELPDALSNEVEKGMVNSPSPWAPSIPRIEIEPSTRADWRGSA